MVAKRVELLSGRHLLAKREVLVCAGAYRTPQLLLLSGIGPETKLVAHKIAQTVETLEVGENLHDHMAITQWWKLRKPDKGLSIGSPLWTDPAYRKGSALDYLVSQNVPYDGLKDALSVDKFAQVNDTHSLLSPPRCHTESYILYGANVANAAIPLDGSHISDNVIGLLPTSRGTISLASADPVVASLIGPNYYATEADRYVIRTRLKRIMQVLGETDKGKAFILGQTTVGEEAPLSPTSSDEELDAYVRKGGK